MRGLIFLTANMNAAQKGALQVICALLKRKKRKEKSELLPVFWVIFSLLDISSG